MRDTVMRGQIEWENINVVMLAEIQRNSDGTWSGMIRRLSGVVISRPTKEDLLLALADLHSTKERHGQVA